MMAHIFGERADLLQVFEKRPNLDLPDLDPEILLPVQVGHFDAVVIRDDELPDARPGEGDGGIRPQPASARNPDNAGS